MTQTRIEINVGISDKLECRSSSLKDLELIINRPNSIERTSIHFPPDFVKQIVQHLRYTEIM